MVRGGSWNDFEVSLRTFSRLRVYAEKRNKDLGLRVSLAALNDRRTISVRAAEPVKP